MSTQVSTKVASDMDQAMRVYQEAYQGARSHEERASLKRAYLQAHASRVSAQATRERFSYIYTGDGR